MRLTGHGLEMADQRLHARQAPRTTSDQQNITAIMRDRFAHCMKRRGQRELTCQHRILHFAEIHMQRHGKQVEGFRASRQSVVDSLLQVVHHIAGRLLRQQIAQGGMQTGQRIVNVAGFPRGKDRMTIGIKS